MSHAFTIVPEATIETVRAAVAARVARDPAVVRSGEEIYFAGARDVVTAAAERGFMGLACVRIPPGSRVLHVDAEGYEMSLQDLARFVRWALLEFGPCRILDDESGEDLDWRSLFEAPPEFVDADVD